MKLNELKAAVFQATGLSSIAQIKKFYPQFSELNFRLKATWQTVLEAANEPAEQEFHQEDIDMVIAAITIPAEAISCEMPLPTPDDWAQVLSLIEPWGEQRNELAAQRIRRQFRRRRWRADRKRGFAAAA